MLFRIAARSKVKPMTTLKTDTVLGTDHALINEKAVIPPKLSTTVTLGVFEKSVPEPKFDIDFTPKNANHDNVRAMFVKVPEGHEYRMQCVFLNFTTHPFTAKITEKPA